MRPVDKRVKADLDQGLVSIEAALSADVVSFVGPILPSHERSLRDALDALDPRRESVAVILDTPGGVVEVVERMVTVIRSRYENATVIVPDRAMSAGTILALSADRIMMDDLSCLGPIDPQIEKDGKLVPALSYLNQFERLNKKSIDDELTTAEYALINKLDLGDLYQFDQARALSNELLVRWLSTYKFKNWHKTETKGRKVSEKMKKDRADKIARLLNDPDRWHSHGRAIDRETLRNEVNLKIDALEDNEKLYRHIRDYFALLEDFMQREKWFTVIHSRRYF